MIRVHLILFACVAVITASGQDGVSKVWVADKGDGTYKNPVLHADYSDPDVVRVGNDYYLVSSSFEDVPGLPILHSRDLVNWTLIGHALKRLLPVEHFSQPRHGAGVWAPSIRFHKNEYIIYYPDPDFGIYMVKAKHPAGPWSEPLLVETGKGLIDPCPLWDDDGKVYLVHAFAGSRAGIKSILVIKQLNDGGTKVIDEGKLVYDGHGIDPTVEGPKIHKRDGWYYIFAPAGGVSTGWQLVLRSKNIYGPYERRIVMDQGSTSINGPHQGAWVTTPNGEDWFIHFQDKKAYGRVVHLQPMKWVDGWPVIGIDRDGDGKGEPVLVHRKPSANNVQSIRTPIESDEFNATKLGLQWQWMANPKAHWSFMNATNGTLRLYSDTITGNNLWYAGNVLQQKLPAESVVATTKMQFVPNCKLENETAGLAVMGQSYAGLGLRSSKNGIHLISFTCQNAEKEAGETATIITKLEKPVVYLRVTVSTGASCQFSYSLDGKTFVATGNEFVAIPGLWKGVKLGLFCTREGTTNDSGYADFDWFRVEK
jgi:beta-xylosidase